MNIKRGDKVKIVDGTGFNIPNDFLGKICSVVKKETSRYSGKSFVCVELDNILRRIPVEQVVKISKIYKLKEEMLGGTNEI